jgi:hypothetical protein
MVFQVWRKRFLDTALEALGILRAYLKHKKFLSALMPDNHLGVGDVVRLRSDHLRQRWSHFPVSLASWSTLPQETRTTGANDVTYGAHLFEVELSADKDHSQA